MAVLTYNGIPIKVEPDRYTISEMTLRQGKLSSFKFTLSGGLELFFILVEKSDFRKSDIDNLKNSSEKDRYLKKGYYQRVAFFNYINNDDVKIDTFVEGTTSGKKNYLPVIPLDDNSDWGFVLANEGDLVEVSILDQRPPFSYYYKLKKYSFKVKYNNGAPKSYNSEADYMAGPVFEGYPIQSETTENDLGDFDGLFYTKNFGSYIDSWEGLNEQEKKSLSESFVHICWKIVWVIKHVKKLAILDVSEIENAFFVKVIETDPILYDALSLSDRIVGTLLWQWGNFYIDFGGGVFDFDRIFPTSYYEGYVEQISRYKHALDSFYDAIYSKTISDLFPDERTTDTLEEKSRRRVEMLIKLLPSSGLSMLPPKQRLEILDEIIKRSQAKKYNENGTKNNAITGIDYEQEEILKLINSFEGTLEANLLLDFLAEIKDGESTRFEILFRIINDNRVARYPFISLIVDGADNKMYFCFILHEKWKISKYNIEFVPPGGTVNDDGLYEDSFFLQEGDDGGLKYWQKNGETGIEDIVPILEFTITYPIPVGLEKEKYYTTFKAKEKMHGKLVIVEKHEAKDWSVDDRSGHHEFKPVLYGNYHLYQPITIVRFIGNIDFELPQMIPIPAFLFFYTSDYIRLKKIDATISFLAEASIEFVLFYFTGGASVFRHLKYLKYVNRIGKAFRSSTSSSEAVLIWRGAVVGAEIMSLSAGVLYSTSQLIKNTTTSAPTKSLMEKLSKFLLALTLLSAGGAVYSRVKAIKCADEVVEEIEHLSHLGIPHTVDEEVIEVIYTIRNTELVKKTLFRNHIVSLVSGELGESNHIADIYDGLSEGVQTIFLSHFGKKVGDIAFWQQMNKTENGISAARMKAWRDASPKFYFLRREFWFLDNVIYIKGSYKLNEEVFKGISGKKLKDEAIPPYGTNDYQWYGKGIHHKDGLQETGKGGLGMIVGSKIDLGNGYYRAKLKVYNPELPENGGWKVKPTTKGTSSSFFPDEWTKEETQEMLAFAYRNKKYKVKKTWDGTMLDGVSVRFHFEHGVLTTAYPIF